ncbi:hypothetical protein HK097_008517 [Rhizophlyctis rosea]|uniref:Transmembrane protein 231 n=1 Tax=Rhizophlyctis rosea TaxID=64517 RepID=A0AAD5SDF8_9FUNG|nr:hypothetical protein HK097_008517 [Rhizophlyctis rosea]
MLTVYSTPYSRRFQSPILSLTTLTALLFILAAIILPFVFAYASGCKFFCRVQDEPSLLIRSIEAAFWLKEQSLRTQPSVQFTKEVVCVLEGTRVGGGAPVLIAWSTDEGWNMVMGGGAGRVVSVKTAEVDANKDGVNEYLTVNLRVPLLAGERVSRVRVGVGLRYDLMNPLRFQTHSLALLDLSTPLPSTSLDITGDLTVVQRKLLRAKSQNVEYDVPPIDFAMNGRKGVGGWWKDMWSRYFDRDVYTTLQNTASHFSTSPPLPPTPSQPPPPFTLSLKIRYTPTYISYIPTPWQTLKNAWIQYLSYFLLVAAALWVLWGWMVTHGVLDCWVKGDYVPVPRGGVGKSSGYVF